MSPRSPQPIVAILVAGFLGATSLHAQQQQQDSAPPDIKQFLTDLKKMAATQAAQAQAAKLSAMQTVSAASGASDGGVSFWETAVRTITIDGAGQDNNNFRIWKETDGEVFKDKAVQNAVHLHLEWLALTLKRSAGASAKDMMPAVMGYTRELWNDLAYMSMLDATIKKDKDTQPPPVVGRKGGGGNTNSPIAKTIKDDTAVRRAHDQILNHSLNNSIVVQMMRLADYLTADSWEFTPGNIDGIYKNIIQPELRSQKDPHVVDYWDIKLKVEADAATLTKLTFEVDRFNNETRPALMWGRAEEYANIGQKNRAATEMFNIIKSFPNHPSSGQWIAYLQGLLAPPAPDTATAATAPAGAPAPLPGAVVVPPVPTVPAPNTAPNPTASLPGALPGQ